jgi:hypothetical protein
VEFAHAARRGTRDFCYWPEKADIPQFMGIRLEFAVIRL